MLQITYGGLPKSPVERYMAHYGVDRREAERMYRMGTYLPPYGSGRGLKLSGLAEETGITSIINEIKEHPLVWGIIALIAIWVFTRKWETE